MMATNLVAGVSAGCLGLGGGGGGSIGGLLRRHDDCFWKREQLVGGLVKVVMIGFNLKMNQNRTEVGSMDV